MTLIEKKQELMRIRVRREQWLADGCRPYREQYIWDYHHDGLTPLQTIPDEYEFHIQISDSPFGDTWWNGRCRFINDNTDVEIVYESYRRT